MICSASATTARLELCVTRMICRRFFASLMKVTRISYPDAELREIAQAVETLFDKVPLTHVVLNNNHEDQGQRNAKTLIKFLKH